MAGWIKLHRKIREHWVWEEPLYLKWWLDILLMANYNPAKILLDSEVKLIGVGEHHTSIAKLAKRWNADRKTVDKFLALLEADGMIFLDKKRKSGTTLKVANYKAYQALFSEGMEDIMEDMVEDITEDIMEETLEDIVEESMDIKVAYSPHKEEVKEREELKEVKEGEREGKSKRSTSAPVRRFAPPSLDEVTTYCLERNNNIDPQRFIDFYQSKGWMIGKNKMKDWHAAVGTWEKRRKTQAPQGKPTEAKPKRSKFCNYQGREHDYDKEERMNQELLEREFQKRRERAVRDEL